ncbi:MAG TPA: hypothetical protein VMZ69_00840 [Saprospiraceae bacterium]|nr:hypothetical protein [Saprospiraceae bacterium]
MDQNDLEKTLKAGLPEALHPEIGNGASWESDPSHLILRSIDPTSGLDPLLHDEDEKLKIIAQWNQQLSPTFNDADSPKQSDNDLYHEPAQEEIPTKRKEKKIRSSKPEQEEEPDWFENHDELDLKADPHKPTELESIPKENQDSMEQPEGKRVRKAIKKAKKESKQAKNKPLVELPRSMEANLSPFTSWLKSLRGSEYVHPYEDDYALGQLSISGQDGISETFADLLAAQGYKDQAIDMYKLLMAKNPEKSSFFAAKIEALK